MKEASPFKFYLAKYFFLVVGLLQWIATALLLLRFSVTPKTSFAALVTFTLGLLSVSIFTIVSAKLKRVAIGKNKVAVIENAKTKRYKWPEVKMLKLIPFFNLYKMKIKGRKKPIYFLPTQHTINIYGMFPTGARLSEKGD